MFAPVHDYIIFEHPVQGFEAVKIGWLWPAFFFTFLWALNKRLWPWAFVILIGYALISVLGFTVNLFICGSMSNPDGCMLLNTMVGALIPLLAAFVAHNGSVWRELNLIRRGYESVGGAKAQTPEGAISQYCSAIDYHWRSHK